jgi:translation initiation factor IF-2
MPDQDSKTGNYFIRPPIVVVLGHVDHGKTSILDKIRQTKIAEREAGGITQHIGAYQVEHPLKGSGQVKKITFLDTPGHEAFTAIRSRGAKVADIAILVVAADEGVKPQTKEAIQIIKSAEIPFIVAINKVDKEGANSSRVRQELAEQEVLVEDYGGNVPVVELSAKNGNGLDELLEMILLVAELEELSSPLDTPAKGIVIESHLDGRRGLLATLVVQDGELKIGDWIVAGNAVGRARSLENFLGKPVQIVISSEPCVMLGWEIAPKVGQEFQVVASQEIARQKSAAEATLAPATLFSKEISTEADKTAKKLANLIIKSDVQSSLEAIDQVLRTIHSEEVGYNVVNYGVGTIGETDIQNAIATKAAIIGFHVGIDSSAKQMAERENVKIVTADIIYELAESVRSIMSDLLEPEIKRVDLGKLKVLAIFKISAKSQIIGGKIVQGKAARGATLDVVRNGAILATGKIGQLQHKKADVAEVTEGLEAGIRFDASSGQSGSIIPIKEGDLLEIYEEERIKRTV